MMTWKHKLAALTIAGTIFGCSSPPPTAPSGTPSPVAVSTPASPPVSTADWKTVQSKDKKLKISLPPGWVVADPKNPEYAKASKALAKANPSLPKIDPSSFFFMCLNSKSKVEAHPDNLNVMVKPVLGKIPPLNDATAQQLKAGLLQTMPVEGEMEVEAIKLPAGDALHYSAVLKTRTPKGDDLSNYCIGYMLAKNSEMFVVTFSTQPENKDTFTPIVEQMMETVSIQ